MRRLSRLHRLVFALTGGHIGRRLVNNDILLLTTTGVETGAPHTVPLLYLEEGESLVVFASYGGRARHPQWYLNLEADPRVEVQIGTGSLEATARTAQGAERAHLWRRALTAYEGYAAYQRRAAREIPVVVLSPAVRVEGVPS